MPGSSHYNNLAFFQEITTQGLGPANAAAWVAAMGLPTGARIAPLQGTVEVSGILPTLLDNESARDRITDDEPDLVGIDNPEFGFEVYAETLGAVVVDGSAAVHTAQTTLMEHTLGGADLGTTRTALGTHSTTTIELDSVAGLAVGGHIAPVLSAYTGPGGATMAHVREIIDITALVVTVDQPFPVAPVDTDEAKACITAHIDLDVLENSSGAGGPYTLSWHIGRDKATASSDATWEVYGAKAQVDSVSFERDSFAKMAFTVMGGSSERPNTAAKPAWTSDPLNQAPMQVGKLTQLWLADYDTAGAVVDCNAFSLEFGVPVTRAPTITTNSDGMQGTACYTTAREDTVASITLFPHTSALWGEFDTRTLKACRYAILAPPGSGFAVTLPRCEVRAPDFADVDGAAGNTFELKALPDDNLRGTTELVRSKIKLVWY